MPMLDIFTDDAFGIVELTEAINKMEYVPGSVSASGIFTERGITTTVAMIEERNGVLALVAPTPRGGPGSTIERASRKVRPVRIPHFEINDAVMADEVQGVRAFGTDSELETVQGVVADKQAVHTQDFAATQEFSRLGAIKGVITYADSSELDLFDLFDVSAQSTVFLNLASATAADIDGKLADMTADMGQALQNLPWRGIHALCGLSFWKAFRANSDIRDTFLGWSDAALLRAALIAGQTGNQGTPFFTYGGVEWELYVGAVGNTDFIEADKAYAYPMGAPGLFRTYYAPADYTETVNTQGRRLYTRQYDMPNGKGINLDTQMNALEICTQPRALFTLDKDAS